MTPRTATLIGLTAILMWSLLAVMTVATGKIPAFQLAAMTFAIGAVTCALTWIGRSDALTALRQPLIVWTVGVGGLFGYHALYFLALRFAPPAEAGLLNYLWPLLIVLFSSLLPGERLAFHHIVGAMLGLAGTVLLFAGNASFAPHQVPGLIAAFVAAFVWAAYSVLSRRLKSVPTDAVAGFCAATALLAALMHALLETTVWPETALQWAAIVALGIGPVGAAFYAWDIGMKRGDIRVLGAASYATPLLSTAFLILAGFAKASANIALAAVLIAGGGLIAAKDMVLRRRPDIVPGHGLRLEQILDPIAAWAASRPDVLGLALIGSQAQGTATPSSDVDLIVLATEREAFRGPEWLNQIIWPTPARVIGWRDANYGAVWSRHVEINDGPEIEFTFTERSWVATDPVDPSTSNIVRAGCQILVDREGLFERLKAAAPANG